MKIKNWFKSISKLDNELTSMKDKEVTATLPCPANQHNTDCNLVEQLREKQKELKDIYKKYDSERDLYKQTFQQVLFPKIACLIRYRPLSCYINYIYNCIHEEQNGYYRNRLANDMIEYPIEDNQIDEIIDFFTEYKAMITKIKDIPNQKKQLTEDIKSLKQQLGIE